MMFWPATDCQKRRIKDWSFRPQSRIPVLRTDFIRADIDRDLSTVPRAAWYAAIRITQFQHRHAGNRLTQSLLELRYWHRHRFDQLCELEIEQSRTAETRAKNDIGSSSAGQSTVGRTGPKWPTMYRLQKLLPNERSSTQSLRKEPANEQQRQDQNHYDHPAWVGRKSGFGCQLVSQPANKGQYLN